ncbi:MAG: Ig-like domain-containing protein [Bacillota bacterium]
MKSCADKAYLTLLFLLLAAAVQSAPTIVTVAANASNVLDTETFTATTTTSEYSCDLTEGKFPLPNSGANAYFMVSYGSTVLVYVSAQKVTTGTFPTTPGLEYTVEIMCGVIGGQTPIFGNVSGWVADDTAAPAVSLTAPPNGAYRKGEITVAASASDANGVSQVEFYVDNILKSTDFAVPYIYSLNTASYADGSHPIKVKAYDAAGNNSSAAINVTFDNQLPAASIITPLSGAFIRGTADISFTASDNILLLRVELYFNSALLVTYYTGTGTYPLNTVSYPNGPYDIVLKAYDAAGNTKTVTHPVTVDNPVNITEVQLLAPIY